MTASIPATMQAVGIRDYGDPDVLEDLALPVPQPGAGMLLVKVQAAAANPFDTLLRQGVMRAMIPLPLPAALGMDLAGIVVATGEGVDGPAVGTPVFGRALMGSMAEYALATPESVAVRPEALGPEAAASLPTAAIAAWHALHSYAAVQAGETVFVLGGATLAGQFAIQFARQLGAKVVATAGTANVAHVRGLGADEVIDHQRDDLRARAPRFDAVLDMVGPPAATQVLALSSPATRFVSLGAQPDAAEAQARGVTLQRVLKPSHEGDAARLAQMAQRFTAGQLKTDIAGVVPLTAEAVRDVHRRLGTRRVRGKFVIRVAA